MPVAYAKGRIWRAMEDNLPKGKRYFRAFMMSAPIDANLLDSACGPVQRHYPMIRLGLVLIGHSMVGLKGMLLLPVKGCGRYIED